VEGAATLPPTSIHTRRPPIPSTALRRTIARLFPNPSYYGWVIVAVGFACSALSSPGQSYAISFYVDELMAASGLTRVELSSVYAGATLTAALLLPYVGAWADRLPARLFLAGILALLGLAISGLAATVGPVSLVLAFFALRLLGQGAINLGTLTATVRWFYRYRARALALVTLGYAAGELVFPWLIFGLQSWLGWRGSLLAMGAAYLLVMAPLAAALLREREPHEPLDGEQGSSEPGSPGYRAERSWTLGEIVRLPSFWAIVLLVCIPPFVVTAVIFHQVALFGSLGWAEELVPPAFTAFALAGIISTYGAGIALERHPSGLGVALSLLLFALAFTSPLLALPPVAGALVYGALLGAASGTIATTNSVIWPDYYGIEALGRVKGVVNAFRNGSTALGPPVAAALATPAGRFILPLLVFAGICVAAGFAALLLRPPRSPAA
jgi:MFS family permease